MESATYMFHSRVVFQCNNERARNGLELIYSIIKLYLNYNLISILCQFLQIEEANDCRYDYVEIFSGVGIHAKSLGRACGSLIPKPVVSRSHKMVIKFHSDALIAKRGFKARYETCKYNRIRLHLI